MFDRTYHIPFPLRGSSPIFFSKLGACTLLFSISGLDIQELAAHACSRFAHGCSRFAHGCSWFAHGLLTVSEVPFESFTFFLNPYEVPFGSLRGCSRFAHTLLMLLTLWGGPFGRLSIWMRTSISKPCRIVFVLRHPQPFVEAGLPHP